MYRYILDSICYISGKPGTVTGPLHDIVIANIVWCMAYTREIEAASYIAQ